MENLLIPYFPGAVPQAKAVLVVAPHPDDEVFGCGGAILRHIAAGVPVHVVILSDGAFHASDAERQALIEIREAESRAAAKLLGYPEPEFWRLPDRGIEYGETLIKRLMQTMEAYSSDLVVYAPSLREMHPDHRQAAMATVEAVRRLGGNLHLAMYEVGIPLQQPNLLLDISDVLDRKQAAMSCFVSQLSLQRYDEHILALNRYRSYTLPKDVTAAEAYQLVTSEALAQDPLRIYQPEYARQQAMGLPQVPDDLPLVSVLIRSMNRPTLRESLDSVALQTYGHIEVVVVAACGQAHADIGETCGRFPLRLEFAPDDSSLKRSHAANLALERAKGQWLIFLDDDDTLYPDHIAVLIQKLRQHPQAMAAYAGVRVENDEGHVIGNYNFPYDRRKLLAFNYIPIHAVLFSHDLIGEDGARFDKNMDVYEDWDFWLQLSQRTSFLHVDKISAVYRALGDSGVGLAADENLQQQGREQLFNKWRLLWTGRDINCLAQYVIDQEQKLAEREQRIADQEQKLAERGQKIAEQELKLAEQEHKLAERDSHILALYDSTSWRVTEPLRLTSYQLKRIRRAAELARPAIKRGGGLRNTLNKAIQLYRHDGLAGIRHGFRIVALSHQISPALGSGEFDRNDYAEWIRRYDTLTDDIRVTMNTCIAEFARQPLISVVMPTYNPKPEWLIEAIESVRKQIYPYWELCIADDASTDKAIRPILERYANEDSRIKVVFRESNGHISEASNSALELVSGEWVALLDHDDLLSEHALFWVVDAVNQNPDARLIYSDEDKIDEVGKRFDPYFKCDWNVDLFYSQNMISHLGVYRTDLLNSIGGFRKGMEGSQDYDLALRSIERIEPKQIHHIPRVLYHWRMHVDSTAHSPDAKPYAMLTGERALNEHFNRQKINARAELIGYGYRLHYALPDTLPMVSLIIPTRNGLQLIRQCIESIFEKTIYPNYEILIVDNNSDDPATLRYLDSLRTDARVRVVRDERPFNYSALNNAAVKLAQGEVVGLLNNDLEVISPQWLSEMVSIALQPGVGATGARLLFPNDAFQHAGVVLGLGASRVAGHAHYRLAKRHYGYFGRASLISSFSAVSAACLVIRKAVYEEVGGLDEANLQVAFNDVDFCLRVREAGYRNVWTPYAELYHHESATRGFEDTPEKQARFARETQYMKQRWGNLLLNDPAYSPNLTLDYEDFSLNWPPRVPVL